MVQELHFFHSYVLLQHSISNISVSIQSYKHQSNCKLITNLPLFLVLPPLALVVGSKLYCIGWINHLWIKHPPYPQPISARAAQHSPAPAAFTPLSLHPASKPRTVNTSAACNTHPRGHTSGCEAEEQECLLWYLLNGNIRIGYTTQLAALQTLCFHGEKLFN